MKDQRFEAAFARVNLDRLAEAELKDIAQLRGLKALYEAAYPETRNGENGGRGGKKNENVTLTFSKKLSGYEGISLRTAERYIKIADGVSSAVERRIYSSEKLIELVAQRRMELLALAGHDAETQDRILDLIEAGKADSVAEAEEKLKLRKAELKAARHGDQVWRKLKSVEIEARNYALGKALDEGLLDKLLAERGYFRKGVAGEEVVTESELEKYVSAADLVKRPLPGLPGAKKSIHERAAREGWRFIDAPGRGGMFRLYLIDDLPATAIAEYERRQMIARLQRRERERDESKRFATSVTDGAGKPLLAQDGAGDKSKRHG